MTLMIKFILPLLFLVGCGKPITTSQGENSYSSALRKPVDEKILFGISMSKNFDLLPLWGEVIDHSKYWSGDSWRFVLGSINYRWNSPKKEGRLVYPPRPQELMNYTEENFRELAPSEKYDLLLGRYDYPLKSDVDRFLPPKPLPWEGLCHGWAGASLNHKEPKPVTLKNPDGLMIPFGSADIKALLSYYYAGVIVPDDQQLGKRCERLGLLEDDTCDNDVTPVDFHTILTNTLGLRGTSFIMDIDRFNEVWNHPITGYQSRITGRKNSSRGQKVTVETTITYVDVADQSNWEQTNGTLRQIFSKQQLEYELDLDPAGNMISGKWISRNRPDFIWIVHKVQHFEGYLKELNQLVQD